MENKNDIIISTKGLVKSFGELDVLKGIDVDIHKGDVVCIIGASGSGKSTFLRCLNLLETPTDGDIFFEETELSGGIGEHLSALLLKNGFKGEYKIHAVENEFLPAATVSSAIKSQKLDCESMLKCFMEN